MHIDHNVGRIPPRHATFCHFVALCRLYFDLPTAPRPRSATQSIRGARSRLHDAVIRIYDDAGNVVETYEHEGDFKEW
jgi:hypothetical protein